MIFPAELGIGTMAKNYKKKHKDKANCSVYFFIYFLYVCSLLPAKEEGLHTASNKCKKGTKPNIERWTLPATSDDDY